MSEIRGRKSCEMIDIGNIRWVDLLVFGGAVIGFLIAIGLIVHVIDNRYLIVKKIRNFAKDERETK